MDKRITNAIAIIATILWTTSFILDALLKNYEPPVSVHAVMMIVAGAAFTGSVLKRPGNNDDNNKDEK